MAAGDELGFIEGSVDTLARLHAAGMPLQSARTTELVASMRRTLDGLRVEPSDAVWQAELEGLRARFKRLAAALGLTDQLTRTDASKLTF